MHEIIIDLTSNAPNLFQRPYILGQKSQLLLLLSQSNIQTMLSSTRQSEAIGIMFDLAAGGGNVEGYIAQFTWTAFFCCLIAASGGALFGYDNGADLHTH